MVGRSLPSEIPRVSDAVPMIASLAGSAVVIEEHRNLRISAQDASDVTPVAHIAAERCSSASRPRTTHNPGGNWVWLIGHLLKDRLSNIVIGAPISCTFCVSELVHEMAPCLTRQLMCSIMQITRPFDRVTAPP